MPTKLKPRKCHVAFTVGDLIGAVGGCSADGIAPLIFFDPWLGTVSTPAEFGNVPDTPVLDVAVDTDRICAVVGSGKTDSHPSALYVLQLPESLALDPTKSDDHRRRRSATRTPVSSGMVLKPQAEEGTVVDEQQEDLYDGIDGDSIRIGWGPQEFIRPLVISLMPQRVKAFSSIGHLATLSVIAFGIIASLLLTI